MNKELHILQLYSRDMNIYGDWGNVLTLMKRVEWHGLTPVLHEYNPGSAFPEQVDILVGGGGQDKGQDVVQADLQKIKPKLLELAHADTPMILICGLYQLFGNFFKTKDGQLIEGIGLFDIETHGGSERMIGNIVIKNDEFGEIIGYENHSGQTYLLEGASPLGEVVKGAGNNGRDATEGARFKNVIGTYLHGSLLPKNPVIADWLIEKAATKKFGEFTQTVIDDRFAQEARAVALTRPR